MGDVKWSDVRRIAVGEIGYEEGPNNWNKYADFLDNLPGGPYFNYKKQNVAWCTQFTAYCIYKASNPDPRGTAYAAQYQPRNHEDNCAAGCKYNAQYYRNAGKFFSTPEPGDVFFVGTKGNESHTGFVDKVNGNGSFTTIEGNHNNKVDTCTRWVSDMSGFGRPWYTAEDVSEPEPSIEKTYLLVGPFSDAKTLSKAKASFTALGYNVQEQKSDKPVDSKKSIEEVAREVIAGKWKNYPERKRLLEAAGYNYSEVQSLVNKILKGG